MEIGIKVEYETGIGAIGIGEVMEFDEETEMLTVRDSDDGSAWRGPFDRATIVVNN